MALLRFATARDVFEAFPTAHEDINSAPSDQPPVAYLRDLAKGQTPDDALAFCAYLLPRREAVWWASQCVRALLGEPTAADETALNAAEEWVREPGEENRRRVLATALSANRRIASTWVALAAGWSGGPMVVSDYGGPAAPPQLTAQSAFTAIEIALGGRKDRAEEISRCVERGARIIEG
ncbi:MAG TPA: hypothetical protein VKC66_11620 [Xanthobacteraceae bacterium]|nr:hypothetical protein [Xanthobacteraceae bacterium]